MCLYVCYFFFVSISFQKRQSELDFLLSIQSCHHFMRIKLIRILMRLSSAQAFHLKEKMNTLTKQIYIFCGWIPYIFEQPCRQFLTRVILILIDIISKLLVLVNACQSLLYFIQQTICFLLPIQIDAKQKSQQCRRSVRLV